MLAGHKGEIPFVIYIIPFLAGIWLVMSFDLAPFQQAVGVAFGLSLCGFIILNSLYEYWGLYRRPWLGGALMTVLLLLTGMLVTINFDGRNHRNYFTRYPAEQLLIRINSEPQLKGQFLRFTSVVEEAIHRQTRHHTTGDLLVTIAVDSARAKAFAYGDMLLIPAKYNPPDPPFNPGEFNYKRYLAEKNVHYQTFTDLRHVIVAGRNSGNPIIAYSLKLRQRLVAQFKKHLTEPEAIAVASTLILGYKAELDNDVMQAYSKTGTIHVLSVSGAHVAIIFMMLGWMLGFLDRWPWGKYTKALLITLFIWYYALLTGLSPAVCRAAVMITTVILGNTFSRRIIMLNLLAVSAMVILLIDPFLLMDVGFQLSYLALIGLLIFQPVIYYLWDIENKWLDKLWKLCAASIAIQAVTFPLSAYYFHQFPIYFLISNLLIIFPVEVIMYTGIACLLAAQGGCDLVAGWIGKVLQHSILLMNDGLRYIEHLAFAVISKIWLNRLELCLMMGCIIMLSCMLHYRKAVWLKASLICLLLVCISFSTRKIRSVRCDQISYLNLKKHTGIVFKQGSRAVVLTDLRDTDKIFKYAVRPGLDSSGVDDVVILPPSSDIALPYFKKQGNWIRWIDKDVVMIDKYLWLAKIGSKLVVDHLFITGSPHIAPGSINANFDHQLVIADAANSDKAINAIKAGLNNYDKKMYLLKRNRALILESKPGTKR